MIYTAEELLSAEKIYVLDTDIKNIIKTKHINYAVYKIVKYKKMGIGKWYFELETKARNKLFHKKMKIRVNFSLNLPKDKMVFDSFKDLVDEYNHIVEKSSLMFPSLSTIK